MQIFIILGVCKLFVLAVKSFLVHLRLGIIKALFNKIVVTGN